MKVHSSRNKKIKKISYITIAFAFVIILGMLLPRVFNFLGTVVMTPVHVISQWYETSEQMIPMLLRERNDLQDQIKSLENELVVAGSNSLTLRRLQDENNRLRALLSENGTQRTVANVIARPGDIPYDLLQIDRGSDSGINENSLVYVGQDQLIGSVLLVSRNYSFVQLFTTPGVEMTGFISGPDVIATVEGMGGGVARVRVPQGIPLSVGDLVYVPSIQPGLFGQIDFVENRPSQPEQFGYIALQTPLQSVYEVSVSEVEVGQASVESIIIGKKSIIAERLLIEESHTVSFEELLATSTQTSVEATEDSL